MKHEEESLPLTDEVGARRGDGRYQEVSTKRRGLLVAGIFVAIFITNAISIVTTRAYVKPTSTLGSEIPHHYCKYPTKKPEQSANTQTAPANEHIEYEYRYIGHDDGNSHLFMGKPRPEYEEAWDDLLQGTYIRLTQDELTKANNATSIRHKDGGFVGGLGVGHNLHCLKAIRHFLHPEHYPIESHRDKKVREMHLDHCLESLRQAVMCNVDFSLNTLEWTPEKDEKLSVTWSQPNRCVNWDRLHDWLKQRQTSGREFVREGIELERPQRRHSLSTSA